MNFIRAGFRTIRENRALATAEIAWRWGFGFAAWLLVALAVRAILSGIAVSDAEAALAKSNNQFALADSIVRIIVQVLPRMAEAALILVPALAVLWIAASTIGRAITLRNLTASHAPAAGGTLPLLLLNCLRAVFTVATLIAFFGVVILVSAGHPSPENLPVLVLLALSLGVVVGFFWGIVNWFLALAAIFIVRDGRGVFAAIDDSLGLYRDARKEYSAITVWFGLFRAAALLVALLAAAIASAAGSVAAVATVAVVVALLYFAIADYLYIARLAAFVALANADAAIASAVPSAPDAELNLSLGIHETGPETGNSLS